MASWSTIAMGAAGLAVTEAVVSHPKGAAHLGSVGTLAAGVVRRFVSVTTPALTPKATATATATTTTTPATATAAAATT